MAIVKVHNKTRNITYVYESISYWEDYKALCEQALAIIAQKDALIAELRNQLTVSESDNRSCRRLMKKACDILMDTAFGKERING